MADKEFNLLEEKWIRVMDANCQVQEVSLTDALLHAHEYQGLAGELPTQDAALLRLLLAVLHAVFERVDIEGEPSEIDSEDEAIDRWESLWRKGQFPASPIQDYLKTQKENFWLFHPTKPFWQIPNIPDYAKRPQTEKAKKINGSISESGNKVRLFSERTGEAKDTLTNAEIARWLVHMNSYDDNTLKTGLSIALLGQFVVIMAKGSTLFETLMLNFVLLNHLDAPWDEIGKASWEEDIVYNENVRKIAYPKDPVSILSFHSRYGKLERNGNALEHYKSPQGGICYDSISSNEQMAIWGKKNGEIYILRSLKGQQIWREFNTIIASSEKQSSLLVRWHDTLVQYSSEYKFFPKHMMLRYEIVAITYDKALRASVDNIFSDTLDIHLNLFTQVGKKYRQIIIDEIENCEKIAGCIGKLAENLFLASGGDSEKKKEPGSKAKEQFYYEIDVPFRQWLAQLDAEDTDKKEQEQVKKWRAKAKKIAYRLAEKMVQNAGKPAFVGKLVTEKDKKRYYSSSSAMQWFKMEMSKI